MCHIIDDASKISLQIRKDVEKWNKLVVPGNKTTESYVITAKDFIEMYQSHFGVLQKTVTTTIKKVFMKKFDGRAIEVARNA
ncbi:hypothetical protein CRE_02356 [Caenorhabditis remanei]|uniref:Uncharacterized protein n=1 Tax=Caenorhabditis remanei TaxID=31234 RepID=E3MIR0_CAERE|nr:hypothetical protein CRE_02356 [Caenorhabditis remanei]